MHKMIIYEVIGLFSRVTNALTKKKKVYSYLVLCILPIPVFLMMCEKLNLTRGAIK